MEEVRDSRGLVVHVYNQRLHGFNQCSGLFWQYSDSQVRQNFTPLVRIQSKEAINIPSSIFSRTERRGEGKGRVGLRERKWLHGLFHSGEVFRFS